MPTLYAPDAFLTPEPPHYVGRAEELAQVQALLHEATLGTGSALVVAGERGVGKSRFLRECAAIKSSAATLYAQCGSGSIRGHDILSQIGDGLARSGTGAARSTEAAFAMLVDACKRKPVAVLIDDVHLAESPEVHALDALVSLARRLRLVVITCQLQDGPAAAARHPQRWVDDGARFHRLPPLSVAETELLVRSVASAARPLDSDELREVLQVAQGNPRVAVELVGSAPATRAGAPLVARSAQAVVRSLRATLSKADFAALALCSVVGSRFRDEWIVEIAGRSRQQIAKALQAASDAGAIAEDASSAGWYTFRQSAACNALYASIVSLKRRLIHERTVDVLCSSQADADDAEVGRLVAHHWHVLENHANAADWLTRVAERFAERGEFAQAAESYARAARHLPHGSKAWFAVAQQLVRCYRNLAEWAHMIPVVQAMQTTPSATSSPECADALLWDLFFAYLNDGNHDAAVAIGADIAKLDVPGQFDRSEIATLILAYGAFYAGRREEARSLVRSIRFENLRSGEGRLRHLITSAAIDALSDPLHRSLQRVDEAAAFASALGIRGTAHCYGDGVEIALRFGDLAKAREYLERMARTAERSAGAVNDVKRIVDKDRMHLCLLEGDLHAARDLIYASLAWRDSGRHNQSSLAGAGVFVGMRIADFALVDALFVPQLLEASVSARDGESCGRLLPGFAEVMQARGMAKELRSILTRCVEKRLVDAFMWIPLCAARYGTTDCAEAAAALLDDYLRDAIAPAAAAHRALFDGTLWRRRGKHIAAAEAARQAALRYGRLGWRVHEALALEIAGDRMASSAAYERCGAINDAERLAGGQTRKLRRAPFGARLTARELEVARLVAHKRSNTEIARALEISVRTVHHHVEAAFNKLGVRARWQLNVELLQGVEARR